MVRVLLVIQVPDASDEGSVTLRFRPIDCFFLSFESAEHVVRMVFDYVILNGRPFRASLGAGFYVNVRHSLFSPDVLVAKLKLQEGKALAKCSHEHTASSSLLQFHFFITARKASISSRET